MIQKLKALTTKYWENITTFWMNASRLVEGAALLTAAYYNYITAYHAPISPFETKVRIAASVVIGLRGAYELGRWLSNKEVK
jgi:hypothetical protein